MSQSTEQRAARLLAPAARSEELPLTAAEHEKAISAVTAAMKASARSAAPLGVVVPLWRQAAVWVAVAASLVVGIGLGRLMKSSPDQGLRVASGFATASNGRASQLLQTGDAVDTDDRLRTPAGGGVALTFVEGTSVQLGEKSDLTVHRVGAFRHFELQEGRFEARVMKLHPGERFRVETQRAAIEVKGTHFAIDVQPKSDTCPNGTTVVSVEEGVVTIEEPGQALRFVRAGERFVAPCSPQVETAPSTQQEAPLPSSPKTGASRTGKSAPARSALAKMNALYEEALAARKAADPERAVALLRQLRAEFPSGQLDEAAAVEELRLLEKLDPARARAAAQQYLLDFPDGYARDVAGQLVTP